MGIRCAPFTSRRARIDRTAESVNHRLERSRNYLKSMSEQPHTTPVCFITSADASVHTPRSSHVVLSGWRHCMPPVKPNTLIQAAVQLAFVGGGTATHAHWTCNRPSQVGGRC